jgi:hypothetical protein
MTDPSLAPPVLASLSGAEEGRRAAPRWYSHAYNRADLYRLAAAMVWLPRPARLGLARAVARAARRLFPAERAVVRATLEVTTGASGTRLDELTAGVFRDFAMCFSDLVTTNRQPSARLTAHVSQARGTARLEGLEGGMISLTAHVGNWELAGRLLALRSAKTTHVVVAEEEVRALERWVRRDGDGSFLAPRRPSRCSWLPRSGGARWSRSRAIARSARAGMRSSPSSGGRRHFRSDRSSSPAR